MKPTRVVQEPGIGWINDVKGRRHKVTTYTCDNGKTYDINELAAATGVNANTIHTRLARFGWDDSLLLIPATKKGMRISGGTIGGEDAGTEEWRKLGRKPRDYNLARCGCGAYDTIASSRVIDNVMG
jgi:hypothetical protein